ncbi:MAG: DUF4331 family protein [Pseudomonadota bacterium]
MQIFTPFTGYSFVIFFCIIEFSRNISSLLFANDAEKGRIGVRFLFVMLAIWFSVSGSWASDHIDGQETRERKSSDLSDLFAFPSKGGEALTIILNTHPIALLGTRYPRDVGYTIIIRKAALQKDDGAVRFATSDEMRISCRVSGRLPRLQTGTCTAPGGLKASTRDGNISGSVLFSSVPSAVDWLICCR